MNYGYNMATAGVIAAMHRQDVAANNLANFETTGFKTDYAYTVPRAAARIEDGLFSLPSNSLLEKLGAGVLLGPSRTSFKQGGLTKTDNPFDLAIRGEGFLTVGVGGTGPEQTRLTRDGRLTLNKDGQLVTITGGHAVLDESARPIVLDRQLPLAIQPDGAIWQGGAEVGRINLVATPDPTQLRKFGENLYGPVRSGGNLNTVPARGELIQHHVEDSAVDAIKAMMAAQSAASAVASSSRMLQIHDELTGRLINSLGRVQA